MSTTTITDTNQAARTFLAGDEARIDGKHESHRPGEIYGRLRARRDAVGGVRRVALPARQDRRDRHDGAQASAGRARGPHRQRHRRAALRLPDAAIGRCWPTARSTSSANTSPRSRPIRAKPRPKRPPRSTSTLRGAAGASRCAMRAIAARRAARSIPNGEDVHVSRSAAPAAAASQHARLRPAREGRSRGGVRAEPSASSSAPSRTPRYHAGYLEPRATWSGSTAPARCTSSRPQDPVQAARQSWRSVLELDKDQVVVEPSYIGGEFGAKGLSVETSRAGVSRAVRPASRSSTCAATRRRALEPRAPRLDDPRSDRQRPTTARSWRSTSARFSTAAPTARTSRSPGVLPGRRRSFPIARRHAHGTHRRLHQHDSGRVRARAGRPADHLRDRVDDRHRRARARHRSARVPAAQRGRATAIPISKATRLPSRARARS